VDHPNDHRYVFTVHGPQGGYVAVVEAADLGGFRVASWRAPGGPGSNGSAGSEGVSGAACGAGGDIRVVIACDNGPCDVDLLERIIFSAGGDGGSGDASGSGGAGGPARSPTSHLDSDGRAVADDPGCSAGSQGSAGASGGNGVSSSPGNPGHMSVSVVR